MRWILAFLIICLTAINVKSQFVDDFSDGDFTNNPIWDGDTSHFSVNALTELQLDNAGSSGISFLSTPSRAIKNASWEFLARFEFNPSSNNLSRVYLVSDTSDLKAALNGYFVQIGNTADEVSLYRQDGISQTEIIDGRDDLIDTDPVFVRVKVERDSLGMWTLFTDTSFTGAAYVLEGNALDTTYQSSDYFGVLCKYTTTRSDKIFFDNFTVTGTRYLDQSAPKLRSSTLIDQNSIRLNFNEKILVSSVDMSDFNLNGGFGSPDTLVTNGSEMLLSWLNPFTNGFGFVLNFAGFSDLAGNNIDPDSVQFSFYNAQKFDVLITEVMPIPSPSVSLPEWEYVELYNNSASNISIENWRFSDATSTKSLPNVNFGPGERLILCHEDAVSLFLGYGRTLGLSSFPTLNNSGDKLSISDSSGNLIHSVNYSSSWYSDPLKLKGGWSLEMVDLNFPCVGQNNWEASSSTDGGTPGAINSMNRSNPDQNSPRLLKVGVVSPTKVLLLFDESLDVSTAEAVSNYTLNPGGLPLLSAEVKGDDNSEVELILSQPLLPEIIYTIVVRDIKDCSGNSLPTALFKRIGLSSNPLAGDVLINEILFEAKSGSKDYLEIYNASEKIVRLDQLLVVRKDLMGVVQDVEKVSQDPLLLFPGDYLAFSEDIIGLKRNYPLAVDSNLLTSPLPSFPANEGTVELQTLSLQVVDAFTYNSEMHYPLLSSTSAVSLERIRFDAPTQDEANWFSAAAESGFGTPGYRNSQFRIANDIALDFQLTNRTVTPNGDGIDDLLLVDYTTSSPGHTGSAYIYDASGKLVKTLFQNRNLGSNGQFLWDGLSENFQQVRTGAYIFYFESFNLEGNVKSFKEGFLIDLLH